MAISEASKLLGIPVPTIRSWERRYGFPSPARTDGKHRRYSLDEISTLRAVRDEITRGHPAREAVAMVRSGAAAGDRRSEYLDRFTESAAVLDPDGVRRALDTATEIVGVERAIIEVALPGMREMGDRWRSGRCDVANEHLATQAVRQWLARLGAFTPPPYRPRPLVLACAPTELHTIGLEAIAVMLGRRGWACNVLGAMTPPGSLLATLTATRARRRHRHGPAERRATRSGRGVAGRRSDAGRAPVLRRERVRDDEGQGRRAGTYLGTDLRAAVDTVESEIH